jgi:hypothetical protein
VEACFCNIEIAAKQAIVELLNVEQFNLEIKATPINQPMKQSVKGKRIVGAG